MGPVNFIINVVFTGLTYAAFTIFLLGFAYKLYELKNVPVPFKIPQTPQSTTLGGVVLRMAGDVLIFRSLSKGTTALWLTGWVFHFTFFILVIRHLRYFIYPVPPCIAGLSSVALAVGCLFLISLLILFIRRFTNERVRYVTTNSDIFILLLLITIAATGIIMRFTSRPDIVDVKAFIMGLYIPKHMFGALIMHPLHVPANPVFLLHLLSVLLLLIIFPFTKLLHAGGYFLSPTRNMVNNPRDVRHVNPWDNGGENG